MCEFGAVAVGFLVRSDEFRFEERDCAHHDQKCCSEAEFQRKTFVARGRTDGGRFTGHDQRAECACGPGASCYCGSGERSACAGRYRWGLEGDAARAELSLVFANGHEEGEEREWYE